MTQPQSALRRLALRAGIVPEYVDQTGHETRVTSDDTRVALLAAMGIDASTESAASQALRLLDAEEHDEVVPPVRVVPARDAGGLALGYHESAEQTVIVVPDRCYSPDDVLGDGNAFGIIANLYTLRSDTNWGVGDFTDLAALGRWAASVGADFVGVNPLHSLLNRGDAISPYSPVSRLFRNSIYIDVSRVPELEHAPEIRARLESSEFAAELEALRESPFVRYEPIAAIKTLALDALHRGFLQGGESRRRLEYDVYVREHEPALSRYATWMAIAERHGGDWRKWPAELHDANGEAVTRMAAALEPRVGFHRWLQFEADRQLHCAAGSARESGMRIGVYQDLAIGTAPSGADAWAFRDLFASGVSVGAPPDPYSANGQNWGLPPINPRALRRSRYAYFIELVRNAFRHAGALRIDHVMGLFRLFWIPEGHSGKDGAYVRYPHDELLGIIALESHRHRAIVVGEDLGTVPPDVPPALESWGVLSSKVLYFERDGGGAFRAASSYPPLSLATANTHDMPTLAAWWTGSDIDIRAKVGLIEPPDVSKENEQRDRDRDALLQALSRENVLPSPTVPKSSAELRGAVHGFLCRTPARLVGISLDDIAGEGDPVNVPGVGPDKYPSWTRKMRDSLDVIAAATDTSTALRCDGRRGVR
jgi:4-alpha-glucanotransferase